MHESAHNLEALKRRIATLEGHASVRADRLFTLGDETADARIGGGIAHGRLHEIFASEPVDGGSAAGFALMLAIRAASSLPILWLREEAGERAGGLHAPGFAEIGLDPGRLILAVARDCVALLKAAGDSLRCAGLGCVVIEPWRDTRLIDLTASRRLALAAEQSDVTALILRAGAEPGPSAAQTRWEVRGAISTALPADAPGNPAFDVSLLRHRGGPDGLSWRMEWNRDQCSFSAAPLSRAVLPLPAGRSAAADRRVA